MTSILSVNQQRLLTLLSEDEHICQTFYLSGGTALAEFYLHHRFSEDLDFFSEEEFESEGVSAVLKKIQKAAGVLSVRYEQSFNRNLFFLELEKDEIKTEFTYFPFPRMEQKKKIGNLSIDSLIDIAVNKIFTIYQKPRSRDYIDLYFIMKRESWVIADLVKKDGEGEGLDKRQRGVDNYSNRSACVPVRARKTFSSVTS
ncbi:MAG: nucleotidyl transferase AbiEii/AbiGii toxin family protein [Candidatus Uhrbacteria bacterium]|nr:nucleotidyl transferase AbiEii/AbiGii toxin family protein [Candidatus Uhrbacteria bacterium]